MREKRLRATFLLKLVVLGASVGVFALALMIATSGPVRVGTIAFLALFWLIGVEGGLLARAIEQVATRRAARKPGPLNSTWFIDVDVEERRRRDEHHREMERLREPTRDNPSLW
jgi:hypothetical protein